jgi:hypothetical protein
MAKPQRAPDDPAQHKRFVELATELGATGTTEDFDRAFRQIATAKKGPRPEPKKRPKRKAR